MYYTEAKQEMNCPTFEVQGKGQRSILYIQSNFTMTVRKEVHTKYKKPGSNTNPQKD